MATYECDEHAHNQSWPCFTGSAWRRPEYDRHLGGLSKDEAVVSCCIIDGAVSEDLEIDNKINEPGPSPIYEPKTWSCRPTIVKLSYRNPRSDWCSSFVALVPQKLISSRQSGPGLAIRAGGGRVNDR